MLLMSISYGMLKTTEVNSLTFEKFFHFFMLKCTLYHKRVEKGTLEKEVELLLPTKVNVVVYM